MLVIFHPLSLSFTVLGFHRLIVRYAIRLSVFMLWNTSFSYLECPFSRYAASSTVGVEPHFHDSLYFYLSLGFIDCGVSRSSPVRLDFPWKLI